MQIMGGHQVLLTAALKKQKGGISFANVLVSDGSTKC